MDIEGALRARRIAAPAVAARVADRVYWIERPQTTALPAITLQIAVDDREQTMAGFQGTQRIVVQLDIWAATYGDGKAIKEAVIAALAPRATSSGVKFDRTFFTARDLSERTATQTIFRPSIDLTITFSPA